MGNKFSLPKLPRWSARKVYGYGTMAVIVILGIALYLWTRWPPYLVWLIASTPLTFVLFRFDKFQAGRESGRVPESVLLGLALLGGVVGGWAGMLVRPRHKVKKIYFWVVLVLATALHLYLAYFFFIPRA